MTRRRRRRWSSVISMVLGVLVLLTPVVLTQIKNMEQAEVARRYSATVASLDATARQEMLEQARRYNANLRSSGARDPWGQPPDTAAPAYQDYLRQLNTTDAMARVRVPAVGVDLPVQHGTSQRTLATGVGHLYGTALPVGGEGTHSVLTGHTGLATLTMFDNLTHIKAGDVFIIDVLGTSMAYRVDEIRVVLPTELESLRPVPGHDYVTLVTCTPYGLNTHRLLVRGERLTEVPQDLPQQYHSPWQPWMVGVIVVSIVVLVYLIWWLLAERRRKNRKEKNRVTS